RLFRSRRHVMPIVRRSPQKWIREIAVLFADLDGFTQLCAEHSLDESFEVLRHFRRRVTRVVSDFGGHLHLFLGDGALATFGAGVANGDDATRALGCARAMLTQIQAWSGERQAAGQRPMSISIGLQFGKVLLAYVNLGQQSDLEVIGDPVNVAQRLESLARQLDAAIVIGEDLVEQISRERGLSASAELESLIRVGIRPIQGRNRPVSMWMLPRPLMLSEAPARSCLAFSSAGSLDRNGG